MIEGVLLDKIIGFGLEKSKSILNDLDFSLDKDLTDIQESLNIHLTKCTNWAKEVSFKDARERKSITDVYIHLDLELIPARQRISTNEKSKSLKLKEISFEDNIVLLGQPGAGKTTSLKYLINDLLFDDSESSVKNRIHYPVLIKFREISVKNEFEYDSLIIDELIKIFGLGISKNLKKNEFKIDEDELKRQTKVAKEKLILGFLETQSVLLLLDGFDELPSIEIKEKVIREVRLLTEALSNSRFILSSRSGDFNYHIPNTRELEIQPLKERQISDFAYKWLEDDREADDFISKIKESPFFDTAIRPLTIAHLCAIYERIKDIPKKPKTVYRKVIDLMLEEWDQQRSIKRSSSYANFETDRKYDFLCAFAFELSDTNSKNLFTKEEMITSYISICDNFDLPRGEVKKVVDELETHTGLFLQSGYNKYMFAHKSLQEFFMAEYIVKLPSIPDKNTVERFPNEIAIAVSISSFPGRYLSELLNKYRDLFQSKPSFSAVFITRLMLEKPDFDYSLETGLALLDLFECTINKKTGKVSYSIGPDKEEYKEYMFSLLRFNEKLSTVMSQNYNSTQTREDFHKFFKKHPSETPKALFYPNVQNQ
ncbi:NACHT domain-containing protein [Gracilimonas sediminicola]|uniref:NACHT domain-containing protein n=1 Tax=Gracilimonas sediminicola TaxID=2952158 RepID=A0A9X2L297_9BACT|nr:NACHT domain-containing protein [Gracilimonas sediminicola]MCP9290869.1 NACHT domain-containing protein [Gracilimonas sediminicola]